MIKRVEMRALPSDVRIQSFDEVNLGYRLEDAIREASRCLDCKHQPCVTACPVGINIPGFIKKVHENDLDQAFQIIFESSSLPAVCGRVCPQETQCEAVCVKGIKDQPVAIGHLERFVADRYYAKEHHEKFIPKNNGKKIAIVGSGPAGLSCAHDLLDKGYFVDLYEALHEAGGVLTYGIPSFRLPKDVVKREVQSLIDRGCHIHFDVIIGKTLTMDDLHEMGYHAIFVATGAGLPKFMNIPGEMLSGVYSANEFLTRVNLMHAYQKAAMTPIKHGKRVAVIGGGNVALDAARSALRLGASIVYIIYRRSRAELPARLEEVIHAEEEGIIFKFLTQIKEIHGNEEGQVKSIRCVEMTLGEKDASGRPKPIENPHKQKVIPVDEVIMAIGTTPNPLLIQSNKALSATHHGCLIVDEETMETSMPMVFAGGDVVTGSATVILAMEAGKKAAQAIDDKLSTRNEQ